MAASTGVARTANIINGQSIKMGISSFTNTSLPIGNNYDMNVSQTKNIPIIGGWKNPIRA